jgi:hypothetical protein
MPVRLSELVNDLRWIHINIAGQELNVAYRPNAVSIQLYALRENMTEGNIEALCPVLTTLIAEWDLVDDEGAMIPIDEETFRRLPFPLVEMITEQLTDTMGAEKKVLNGTSADGSPPMDKSASVPTGIPSSEPQDTWA